MTGEGQGHVAPAPIVAAAAPFLSAGALRLRGEAVVKIEAWVALQRTQNRAVRKNNRGSHQVPRPVRAAFDPAGVEEHQVPSQFRPGVIGVGGVEIADVIGRVPVGHIAHAPEDLRDR